MLLVASRDISRKLTPKIIGGICVDQAHKHRAGPVNIRTCSVFFGWESPPENVPALDDIEGVMRIGGDADQRR